MTHSIARAAQRRFLICTLTLAALGGSLVAQATDGLAISGTPVQGVTVGKAYSFTPTVSDPSKGKLSFIIVNRPGWATFSSTTGQLSGTPSAAWAGTQENDILITVSDGSVSKSLPEFHIKVTAASGGSDTPVITGTPATSVVAGSTYKFQPTAKDPDGKTLSFSVKNKPSWATFSISTGLLDGTPTTSQTGAYDGIVISASNGTATSALPAFNVSVTKTTTSTTGSVTIDWVAPTKNTNGSALTDLAGFRIYYGTSPSSLTQLVQVSSSTQTTTTIGNLAAGTWYFGGVAYTTTGAQSTMSSVVSTSVP
jgi:hypothetical protein